MGPKGRGRRRQVGKRYLQHLGCRQEYTAVLGVCLTWATHRRLHIEGKESESRSHSVLSNSLRPHGLHSPWDSPGHNTGVGSPGYLPNPGIANMSPTLQADSLPAEPQGKPKNTGVDSLSLLQEILLTQKLNWGLLHCRRILHQLSYEGSLLREEEP